LASRNVALDDSAWNFDPPLANPDEEFALAEAIRCSTGLTELHLFDSRLSNAGIDAIVKALQSTAIVLVDVGNTGIEDQAVSALVSLVATVPSLKVLYVGGNFICNMQPLLDAFAGKQGQLETIGNVCK